MLELKVKTMAHKEEERVEIEAKPVYIFEMGITMERLKLGYVEPPRLLYMYNTEVHANIFLNQTLHHCTHHDTGIYFVKFIDV
jgi:hypothetical protein